MDKAKEALLEALKIGAQSNGQETRLYRSGKLPGLFAGRTSFNAEVANGAFRDGYLELIRTDTKGKIPVEWARVTPQGMEYLVQQESPARQLEELRSLLAINQEGLPGWIAEMQRALEDVQRRFIDEVGRVRQRLDQTAQRVGETLKRLEPPLPEGAAGALPWDQDALNYLKRRQSTGTGARCPLPELFSVLRGQDDGLTMKMFHSGLRRLHDRGAVRLLAYEGLEGPPEPEYALLDGATVYYFAAV